MQARTKGRMIYARLKYVNLRPAIRLAARAHPPRTKGPPLYYGEAMGVVFRASRGPRLPDDRQ